MKKIHKYPIITTDEQKLPMAKGAVALAVTGDDETGCIWLWAMVDTIQPYDYATVHVVGTGNPCDYVNAEDYVGTVKYDDKVWHVFVTPPK